MEEKFFFLYSFQIDPTYFMKIPIYERKWFEYRYIEQKEKENKAMESAKNKQKGKKR